MVKYCERENEGIIGRFKIDFREMWRGEYNIDEPYVIMVILGLIFGFASIFLASPHDFADDGEPREFHMFCGMSFT